MSNVTMCCVYPSCGGSGSVASVPSRKKKDEKTQPLYLRFTGLSGFLRRLMSVAAVGLFCLAGLRVAAEDAGNAANIGNGSQAIWLDVPFIRQPKDGCGAASIAMVMKYWQKDGPGAAGENDDVAAIQRVLYSRHAHGIYASDLQRYLQSQGFRTFAFHGDWEDLTHHLQQGRPLIVILKPPGLGASLHYVVVVGIDWRQGIVMVNDPAERKLLKEATTSFQAEWNAAGNWTLLALPANGTRGLK